jgi:hypothetical protein
MERCEHKGELIQELVGTAYRRSLGRMVEEGGFTYFRVRETLEWEMKCGMEVTFYCNECGEQVTLPDDFNGEG